MRFFLLFILISLASQSLYASDLVFRYRVASTLENVALYRDSVYGQSSGSVIDEGSLLKVLDETVLEHEDDAQNQKFKWYKVETLDGKKGWVFGESIAVILPDSELDAAFKSYHKHRFTFSNGFEHSVFWIGAIIGRDNLHDHDLMNPAYREYYIVITNAQGKSVNIRYAAQSSRGETNLRRISLYDTSGDDLPEIILQTSSFPTGSTKENRQLEIYAFQAGTLEKVLDERMTLSYGDDVLSPALFKSIEIDSDLVRIEYIDYVKYNQYHLPYRYDSRGQSKERCMEFVTYTYIWDNRQNTFSKFYQESQSTPLVNVKRNSVSLRSEPSATGGRRIASLSTSTPLQVIKHHEQFVLERGVKKLRNYFYVKTPAGQTGYVPAELAQFVQCEHADVLGAYYQQPPITKNDWSFKKSFLKIVPKSGASAVNDQ